MDSLNEGCFDKGRTFMKKVVFNFFIHRVGSDALNFTDQVTCLLLYR